MKKEGWAQYKDWLGKYSKLIEVDPKEGETWHVRITNAPCLATYKIYDITERTVVLESFGSFYKSRYMRADIEFVEKA